ncbi:MAG: PBP1A family penicillin-binding protein [Bacillaceae bacterium]|nr:PBP1A family penicillin-binding protein [Bacillaceae bacterium]
MEVMRETGLIRWWKWFKRLTATFFVLTALVIVFLAAFLLYLRSQPLPVAEVMETTTIYDADQQVIDTLYKGENRIYVPLDNIPEELIQATIAIEDRRFYSHFGFDFRRIARAVYVDLKHMDLVQGASTITQQLARNLYLTLEKTWERKVKEALLTVQLEMHYSKDQILEKYLNEIYYGHAAYGAQAAAKTYFDKDVSELNLAEASLLAGIPKGPKYYSPFLNFDAAKQRQKIVLEAMVREGYITESDMTAALNQPIELKPAREAEPEVTAPYFRDYIIYLAEEKYGIDRDLITHGGLKIYTTLDADMQKKAEEVVDKYLPDNRNLQAALIAVDPRTGHIKAMVGGRDYQESQYNRVFARRQPGSSFKPFLYLAAVENGFSPLTEMKSEPTVFTYGPNDEKTYVPHNFGNQYPHDFITLSEAIARSDNIYAVKTHMFLGEEKLLETARRLGIQSEMQPVPSLALGTFSVSPYEMARAYTTLANLGEKVEPVAITKIVDRRGNVLAEEESVFSRVAEKAPVFVLNQMMQGIFEPGGTGHRVRHLLERPAAAKTGTTDYDAWMSGFTPHLVATVWVGYDEGKKLNPVEDATLAAPIWAEFMEQALTETPPALFSVPDGVSAVYVDPESGKLATEDCPKPKLMYFISGTEPSAYCDIHLPQSDPQKEEPTTSPDNPGSFWDRMKDWWIP